MNDTTFVYPNAIGEYGFYYPRTWGADIPMCVANEHLQPHPNPQQRRFRAVQNWTPMLLKSDTGTVTVWRKNA